MRWPIFPGVRRDRLEQGAALGVELAGVVLEQDARKPFIPERRPQIGPPVAERPSFRDSPSPPLPFASTMTCSLRFRSVTSRMAVTTSGPSAVRSGASVSST